MDVLEHLLRADPPRDVVRSVADFFERLASCPFARPIERALWGGFQADRLGYAFVAGYEAALDRLLAGVAGHDGDAGRDGGDAERNGGDAGRDGARIGARSPRRMSLAATESGGAHPRAIMTTLEERPDGSFVLQGQKTFATLASAAEELLVVASMGTGADGKNRLRIARVPAGTPGLVVEDRPPTPFAPEIPHAKVTLSAVTVRAEDVLPGDGYTRYLKPFRTIEDTHVLAAALGHVLRCARAHGFDPAFAEGAAALATAVRRVAEMEPDDPVAHVVLAGLFRGTRRLIAEHDGEWEKADAESRDRWRRDLGIFAVADTAREKRTETAWKALRPEPADAPPPSQTR